METYLVYCVDKVFGILSREVFDRFNLVVVREGGHYQGDALARRKGTAD